MQQLIAPHQTLLGVFPDLPTAEVALNTLRETGFSEVNMAILPQRLEPAPEAQHTEARRSAGGAAVAGTVFGSMAGLLLGFMTIISPNGPDVDPVQGLIGITLAGAGIGAAGTSLIGMLTGSKVSKGSTQPESTEATNYVIVAEQATADQVIKAKEVLKQLGSSLDS